MFVAAGAGARVAKHGNRSVSSKSGSADVLEALGANIMLTPAQVATSIEDTGIGFMFAPNHHSAMKHAAPVRKELGIRTIFNILGPLTNPAGAPNQLLGVFHPDLVGIQVRVLQRLGSNHVLVVYGKDGMDEVSLGAATMVGELKDGEVREYEIHPEDFGLHMKSNRGLKVDGAAESKAMVEEALANVDGTPREIFVCDSVDTGYALYRELREFVHLRQFYIASEHRRRGIGAAALGALREREFPAGKRVLVEAMSWNAAALAFWRSCGFCDRYVGLEAPPLPEASGGRAW